MAVVHQQAEGDDQGAQGDLVQVDARLVHEEEGDRQRERDRERHDEAGAKAQRQEAHQQDDADGLGEGARELAHGALHGGRLVVHAVELQAHGKLRPDAGELPVECLAQGDDVAARDHRHGDAHCVLAHEAHLRLRRVGEAARHGGEVARRGTGARWRGWALPARSRRNRARRSRERGCARWRSRSCPPRRRRSAGRGRRRSRRVRSRTSRASRSRSPRGSARPARPRAPPSRRPGPGAGRS